MIQLVLLQLLPWSYYLLCNDEILDDTINTATASTMVLGDLLCNDEILDDTISTVTASTMVLWRTM